MIYRISYKFMYKYAESDGVISSMEKCEVLAEWVSAVMRHETINPNGPLYRCHEAMQWLQSSYVDEQFTIRIKGG